MTTATATATDCPRCGKKGKTVKPVTLRALLKEEYAMGVAVPEQPNCESGCKPLKGNTGWRFCGSPACDVVYFGEQNGVTFTKSQLSVSVGVKEKTGERPLCYCFGHSVASIKEELRTKGRAEALEDIRAKMKDPGCVCEVKNPSGSCCLGAVAKGIETAKAELKPATSSGNKAGTITKIGTILSAVMASSCCWLPLVLLAVGVSGAGIASTLEACRPLFMVVTFGFLGAAFYFTYRPKKAVADDGHGCCSTEATTGEACSVPATRSRFRMMTLNKALLWIVTVLAAAFLFFPSYVGALFGTGGVNVVTDDTSQTVLMVEGLTCEGCAATVAQAIRSVPGVQAVTVSYEKRAAIVSTKRSQEIPQDEILAVLQKAGYGGKFVEPGEASAWKIKS